VIGYPIDDNEKGEWGQVLNYQFWAVLLSVRGSSGGQVIRGSTL